jgi:hypothetical protein
MCLSLATLEAWLIWLVVICAVIAIVRLLVVPLVLTPMGEPGVILIRVVNIIVWVIVAIAVIYLVFDLLSCVLSGGPVLRH